jgi:hypothetical protein
MCVVDFFPIIYYCLYDCFLSGFIFCIRVYMCFCYNMWRCPDLCFLFVFYSRMDIRNSVEYLLLFCFIIIYLLCFIHFFFLSFLYIIVYFWNAQYFIIYIFFFYDALWIYRRPVKNYIVFFKLWLFKVLRDIDVLSLLLIYVSNRSDIY